MSCAHEGRVVLVPVVVEPVVVANPLAAVPVKIAGIEVAVGVAVMYKVPPISPSLHAKDCIEFAIKIA